jgi:hypothetical protein
VETTVEDMPIPAGEDRREFLQMLGRFDGPAYVRRARGVQEALERLLERCRHQRNEWLMMVRLRVGELRALAGDWAALRPLLAEGQDAVLERLHAELEPRLRVPVEQTSSRRLLRRAVRELNESIERFNRRWQKYLAEVDLTPLNELRDGYNRYYVLEKECALGSAAVARQGFRPLLPYTFAELHAEVPLLPVIEFARLS